MTSLPRRGFLKQAGSLLAGAAVPACARIIACGPPGPWLRPSLAQWSFHETLFSGRMTALEFPAAAARLGFRAVEYVNQFYKGFTEEPGFLDAWRQSAESAGVDSLLIMCDGEGAVGDPDKSARLRTVQNHRKWMEAARHLRCHSIRVNAESQGSFEEQQHLAADGLRQLAELAERYGLHVLVENHGGLSSNGRWLAGVIQRADHPLLGTLPDFGNFRISREEQYDRYQGVAELMPWAEAVSAKSYAFDADGNETTIDYTRMLGIVRDAGYSGYLGIEYEGGGDETAGILATKALIERVVTAQRRGRA